MDVLREFLIRGDFAAAKTVLRYVEQGHLQFRRALQDDSPRDMPGHAARQDPSHPTSGTDDDSRE
jgi:hypothetical protein